VCPVSAERIITEARSGATWRISQVTPDRKSRHHLLDDQTT
jgi:hypothetical protein